VGLIDEDEYWLLSIAGQLVGLGALAERAAGRSLPVRWFVLCVLRWALTFGLDFVVEETSASWSRHKMPCELRCRRADASRLAMVLRALGAALFTFVRRARRFRALCGAVPTARTLAMLCLPASRQFAVTRGALACPCPDTS
jgi:hypothetical protein